MGVQGEGAVSIEEFVTALLTAAEINAENRDNIGYGYSRGWLQEQDRKGCCLPLTKKHCARIVHEFLRCEQKEPDEIDSGPAGKLQDLFDCRVCAGHVMQVYTKGIMDGRRNEDGRYVFGMEDNVRRSTVVEIVSRVINKDWRTPRVSKPEYERQAERITASAAFELIGQGKDTILIDVRSEAEYQERHLDKAVHYTMMEILKNPYVVSERRDVQLLLYCTKGYMSETAAQCLVRAGYERVAYFAIEPVSWDEIIN